MKSIIYRIIIPVFSLILYINGYSQSTCNICTNPGFESGEAPWKYYNGTACQSPTSTPCNLVNDSVAPFQHALQTSGGFDLIVGGTILPVVPPGGGTKSMRLGDGAITGAKASRVSITYNVTQAAANFAYQYAVVLQEPTSAGAPHTDAQRPYFSINVYDEAGNAILCGDLFVLAKAPFTNFKETKSGSAIWYRGWTKAVIPLAAYIGKCVRIEFTATDCTLTDHYGYAYIDASCDPMNLIVSALNSCGGYTLTGPANANDYTWTNITVGGTTGIVGPSNTQVINVNRAGTYQLYMSSTAGTNCGTTLTIAVDSGKLDKASFTPVTTCSSNGTQFTDTSTPTSGGTVTKWAWDFNNDGKTDNTSKNPVYQFPGVGTYPVTLTITVGTCTATITQNVIVNAPSGIPVIDPAGPFCLNSSAVTLQASISGGTWSGKGIANAATGYFDPSLASIGNNTIIYATNSGCPGKDTIIIVINAPASDAGPNITLCSGNTANIGVTPDANNTYIWSPTTGLSSPSIANPTVTLTNTGKIPQSIIYYLKTTVASSGCYSSDSLIVTVNSLPLVNAGMDQTICSNLPVTLSGSISGSATSATWSGGSGTYNPNNTTLNSNYTPTASEITSGSVSLTLTTNDPIGPCPSVNDQMTININAAPTIKVGPDQTICVGSTVTLAGVIGGTATIGTWSGGTGTYNPNNTTPNAVYTPSSAENSTGNVTLTYTTDDPPGLCNAVSSQMKISIFPIPTVNAGPDKVVCNSSPVQLAGSINVGSATWSGGTGTFNPDNKTLNATYTPAPSEITAGSISLNLTTDPIGTCPSSTDQVIFTINPVATVNAGKDQTICADNTGTTANTVTLAGTFGGAATNGLWTGGTGTFNPNSSAPTATYTLSNAELSNASISLIFTTNDPAGPCPPVSDQMTIFINQAPAVNAGPDQTVCAGSTVILSGNVSGSATSVIWSGGSGTFNPNNTNINTIYTPSAAEATAGSVLLTLTTNDPVGPCVSASDQMEIFINPAALVNAGPDQIICVGSTVTLAGVIGGSATNGTWTGGSGTFSPNNTTSNATYTPSAAEITAGNITLIFTTNDPAGPCPPVSDQMTVTINRPPTANIGIIKPVCSGSTVQLEGSVGGSANSGIWSGGSGTYSPNTTTLNAIYTPSAAEYLAGSVTLTLTTNTPTGLCPPASSTVILNFYPPPVVNFSVNSPSGCSIHCVKFTDSSSVPGGGTIISWHWDFGDGGSSNLANPTHCYSEAGPFTITLKVTDNKGCTATLMKDSTITVFKLPHAAFIASPNPVSEFDPTVTFTNLSSPDVNYWFWDFGDGDTLAPNTPNPIHTYHGSSSSNYQPTLIVRNAHFCYDTVSVGNKIRIEPPFSFYIPNAFTPDNSPDVNDYFFGQGTGIAMYDLWIYDRWGNMIFHGADLNDKWDGKAYNLTEFGGDKEGKHQAQRDVYVWKVMLTDTFGNLHSYIGTVTLVR